MSIIISVDEWVGKNGVWTTCFALLIVFICCCIRTILSSVKKISKSTNGPLLEPLLVRDDSNLKSLITDDDLKNLLLYTEGKADEDGGPWEYVIDKKTQQLSYSAKRRDPKDGGATQYLSTTVFENCSPELLRDFYLDNDYRLEWDRTVLEHTQLDICLDTGTEIGCTLKKFPLIMAREYVLAWRIWEGKDQSFYCVTKSCEHHRAPRLPSYKRVESYLSGWCIRKVPGRLACEIKMFHQEELGMQRELAKFSFSRGIWNYVNKMDLNLRRYSTRHKNLKASINAVAYAHQVTENTLQTFLNQNDKINRPFKGMGSFQNSRVPNRSRKFLGKSLLLLGGAMFLSSSTPLGAKIAAAFIARKIVKSRFSQRIKLEHS
ncbi:hypothetical protein O6H91_19G033100 [Diphasiastrum complanatum]|uniref:Uncharacterized protein n=3 Tax=Diphasiastrum complanatum TaxID=34168 RepID=A0ACC2AU58_DIPCM|nr:hypothetical protein O6H91_19G033100 [Diphasiastrum complanatum]KAJ7520983.1 hypothetical protein O6H91_19G033100 [Diphasiastrum complanatum]KAJ7520987.1 hypothetical protein O6H91_19G033100 [Diphasiastrum complanatum]